MSTLPRRFNLILVNCFTSTPDVPGAAYEARAKCQSCLAQRPMGTFDGVSLSQANLLTTMLELRGQQREGLVELLHDHCSRILRPIS
jgi:hypothetical protein